MRVEGRYTAKEIEEGSQRQAAYDAYKKELLDPIQAVTDAFREHGEVKIKVHMPYCGPEGAGATINFISRVDSINGTFEFTAAKKLAGDLSRSFRESAKPYRAIVFNGAYVRDGEGYVEDFVHASQQRVALEELVRQAGFADRLAYRFGFGRLQATANTKPLVQTRSEILIRTL